MGPMHWIHGWGLAYGIYPWGSALVRWEKLKKVPQMAMGRVQRKLNF
jgi:hypothetical protein